uniref:Ovule protein n=1 Tax=Panagrolaimus sp. ES5 TaxID=591445 RepID=A0AC34F2M3_9BILA
MFPISRFFFKTKWVETYKQLLICHTHTIFLSLRGFGFSLFQLHHFEKRCRVFEEFIVVLDYFAFFDSFFYTIQTVSCFVSN